MRLHRFGEDYLEAILILEQKRGYVRSSDVAEQMNVTKPSVTNATRLLREGGFLTMDEEKLIHVRGTVLPAVLAGPGTALGAAFGTMFLSFGNALMFGGLLATLPTQERFDAFEKELRAAKA